MSFFPNLARKFGAIAIAIPLTSSLLFSEETENKHSSKYNCARAEFGVALDVGHTKNKSGAISARGLSEFQYNLKLAQQLASQLFEVGFVRTIIFVRTWENLFDRIENINLAHPNLILSVHHDSVQNRYLKRGLINGVPRTFALGMTGYSIFVSRHNVNFGQSLNFAQLLGNELTKHGLHHSIYHTEKIPGENHALLNPAVGIYAHDRLVILKHAIAPAVLLEAADIKDRDDEGYASSDQFRATVSQSVVQAVIDYCNTASQAAPSLNR